MGVVNVLRLQSMAGFHYGENRNKAAGCVTDRWGALAPMCLWCREYISINKLWQSQGVIKQCNTHVLSLKMAQYNIQCSSPC